MKINYKYIFFTLLTLAFMLNINAYAKHDIIMKADVENDFTIKYKDLPDIIQFKTTEARTFPDLVSIPENSTILLQVIRAQRELRWHKGGIILCKLISFTPESANIPIDISDKDIYILVRKYEEINKKEAWILGTEIVLTQGASFFAPGVDIGYFFIKGAIQREKHPNWFKAGVRNAYDNSIFWFPQKGKVIELQQGDEVIIKDVKTKKVEKLVHKIDKRNERFERQAAKRIARKNDKSIRNDLKNEKKMVDCSTVENALENVVVDRSVLAEIVNDKNMDEKKK